VKAWRRCTGLLVPAWCERALVPSRRIGPTWLAFVHTLVILSPMKTSISLPDPLFRRPIAMAASPRHQPQRSGPSCALRPPAWRRTRAPTDGRDRHFCARVGPTPRWTRPWLAFRAHRSRRTLVIAARQIWVCHAAAPRGSDPGSAGPWSSLSFRRFHASQILRSPRSLSLANLGARSDAGNVRLGRCRVACRRTRVQRHTRW